MANAKKCDRCGNYYDNIRTDKKIYGDSIKSISIQSSINNKREFDLCNECVNDFFKFMNLTDDIF